MNINFFLLSFLMIFLASLGIFSFVVYKFPAFFKYVYLISVTRKKENLFYGTVCFAITIAGIFLFSKQGNLINFPIVLIGFLGLFGCLAYVASFFKINPLLKPYKAIVFGILIMMFLSSFPYAGDILATLLKAYGLGVLFVYYKLRKEIKSLQTQSVSLQEKKNKLASLYRPNYYFIHILVQIVAIAVIATYAVMVRNFATKMLDKITIEQQKSPNGNRDKAI